MAQSRLNMTTYQQILDFVPLLAFFVAYSLQDLKFATIALISTTLLSVVLHVVLKWPLPKKTLIGALFVTLFGGLTIWLDDPFYIKIKSTISFTIFALILLIARYGFEKSPLKMLMKELIDLPHQQWLDLARDTGLFFLFLAGCNEITRQFFSESIWVVFKTFGIPLASMVFFALSVGIRTHNNAAGKVAPPSSAKEFTPTVECPPRKGNPAPK